MCYFRQRSSNVLCVGSADDVCGGWTSTGPNTLPITDLYTKDLLAIDSIRLVLFCC